MSTQRWTRIHKRVQGDDTMLHLWNLRAVLARGRRKTRPTCAQFSKIRKRNKIMYKVRHDQEEIHLEHRRCICLLLSCCVNQDRSSLSFIFETRNENREKARLQRRKSAGMIRPAAGHKPPLNNFTREAALQVKRHHTGLLPCGECVCDTSGSSWMLSRRGVRGEHEPQQRRQENEVKRTEEERRQKKAASTSKSWMATQAPTFDQRRSASELAAIPQACDQHRCWLFDPAMSPA